MNILLIPTWFPTEDNKVQGIFVEQQAKIISEKHNVFVLFPHESGIIKIFNRLKLSKLNHNMFILRPNYTLVPKFGIFSFVFAVLRGFRYVKKYHKIDIIHAHVNIPAGFSGAILKSIYNIPLVITEHCTYIDVWNRKRIHRFFYKYALRKADKIIAVGKRLKQEINDIFLKRDIDVIPNVVNTDIFNLENTKVPTDIVNIMFIGGLSTERKNLPLLLQVLLEIRECESKRFVLNVIGDGRFKSDYIKLAEELGLREMVVFHGILPRKEDVAEMLKRCSFFVMPSKKENFGIAAAEAIACGKPVIVTRCGGPEEYFEEFCGKMIPPDNGYELKNALITMMNTYQKYDKNKLFNHINNNFGNNAFFEKIHNLYIEL